MLLFVFDRVLPFSLRRIKNMGRRKSTARHFKLIVGFLRIDNIYRKVYSLTSQSGQEVFMGLSSKPKGPVWQLQEAKAMLSELVRDAEQEPQIITVRGEEKAAVISMEEYRKTHPEKTTKWTNAYDYFQHSPLYGVVLEPVDWSKFPPPREENLFADYPDDDEKD
jgi:prevent-host-death family protein